MAEKKVGAFFRHLAVELIGLVIVGASAAACMRAAIGVGTWDALSLTLSGLAGVKVGTIGMILNGTCAVIEMIILRRDYKPIMLLQIVYSIVIGQVINLFYYNIFATLAPANYFLRLLLFLGAIVVLAFGDALTMSSGMIGFPLEGACMLIGKKISREFAKVRQDVDWICLVLCLILFFFFHGELTVREGTVIWTVIFGPILGWFMKRLKKPVTEFTSGSHTEK